MAKMGSGKILGKIIPFSIKITIFVSFFLPLDGTFGPQQKMILAFFLLITYYAYQHMDSKDNNSKLAFKASDRCSNMHIMNLYPPFVDLKIVNFDHFLDFLRDLQC
jgi:hypothetical protein